MSPRRSDPHDPAEWLRRARSNLALASAGPPSDDVLYADLAFDAQQAAEKAIKAVLVSRNAAVPKSHSLARLVTLVQRAGLAVPQEVQEAVDLTAYAVETRYPGVEEVTVELYREALAHAEAVVRWAEHIVARSTDP
jgi:HEPN domain-containing protein